MTDWASPTSSASTLEVSAFTMSPMSMMTGRKKADMTMAALLPFISLRRNWVSSKFSRSQHFFNTATLHILLLRCLSHTCRGNMYGGSPSESAPEVMMSGVRSRYFHARSWQVTARPGLQNHLKSSCLELSTSPLAFQDALVLLTRLFHFLAKLLVARPVSLLARIRAVHHRGASTAGFKLATEGRLLVAVKAGGSSVRPDTLAISEASRVSIGTAVHRTWRSEYEISGHSRGRKCTDTNSNDGGLPSGDTTQDSAHPREILKSQKRVITES